MQLDGLIGSRGILPAGELLAAASSQLGEAARSELPTFAWLGASDVALHRIAAAGTLGSFLLALGVAPGPLSIALWMLYLSLVSVGGIFLGYQWDALLLEAGLMAIPLAPRRLVSRGRVGRWRGPGFE